jgi:hypothetical protein
MYIERKPSPSRSRGIARRERHEAAVQALAGWVMRDAHREHPTLRIGQAFGRGHARVVVTAIGTHTVQYQTGDGCRGSIQIPFVGPRGEALPSHRRALVGGSPRSHTRSSYRAGRHGSRERISLAEHEKLTQEVVNRYGGLGSANFLPEARKMQLHAWQNGTSPDKAGRMIYAASRRKAS